MKEWDKYMATNYVYIERIILYRMYRRKHTLRTHKIKLFSLLVVASSTSRATTQKKSFFSFLLQCRDHQKEERKFKIIFLWISPKKLVVLLLRSSLLNRGRRQKFMGNNLAKEKKKTVRWRNLSNDLYWILLRHILSWNFARGLIFSLRERAFNRLLSLFSISTPISSRRASLRVSFLLSLRSSRSTIRFHSFFYFSFDFPTNSDTNDHSYAKNFNENRTDFSLIYRLELFIFLFGRRSFAQ